VLDAGGYGFAVAVKMMGGQLVVVVEVMLAEPGQPELVRELAQPGLQAGKPDVPG